MTVHDQPVGTVLGYPRQGRGRALKRATESYWGGRIEAAQLLAAARDIRLERLQDLAGAGIVEPPSNDFSFYDHVLDTAVLLGAVPERFTRLGHDVSTDPGRIDRYFAMARGTAEVAPLEMTKWFDTNYHYLVPELGPDTRFMLDASKPIGEFLEAAGNGVQTRPVILGPITFLLLSKGESGSDFHPLSLIDRLLPVYAELLGQLRAAGAEWIQLDEPILVTDLSTEVLEQVRAAYATLAAVPERPQLLLASYFDRLGDALPVLVESDLDGLAIDFTGPAAANLDDLIALKSLGNKRLVAGVVDGHNVWRNDLAASLTTLERLHELTGWVDVSSSCSLLHVPLDVESEHRIDLQVGSWLAFAQQKLAEIATLAVGLADGRDGVADELRHDAELRSTRQASKMVRDDAVRARVAGLSDADRRRDQAFAIRASVQRAELGLPLLPTTTIGSFPQTTELRQARAALRNGRLDQAGYTETMRSEIANVIALQEKLGLDVLVHGEPERNDMVQYFAEPLQGFLSTDDGWVQSYGSRYVRPPIIFGDVSRPAAMTVEWAEYAQQQTAKPVKGMLTGPVTMLAWSFVRDDQPLGDTARQVALALRDEVSDLAAAGIRMIQVDEPALRETLPLRRDDRADYLAWAVNSFQLATAGVPDAVQIHTHMCYAEFDDVLDAIVAMDADVISLEAARSDMAIVDGLADVSYPNEAGPGVWDIHSPRVPSTAEIESHLTRALGRFPAERLWVNPDCGLKTRGYAEVEASLRNLVEATARVRQRL